MTPQQQLVLDMILDDVSKHHGKDVKSVRAAQVTTDGDVIISKVEFT